MHIFLRLPLRVVLVAGLALAAPVFSSSASTEQPAAASRSIVAHGDLSIDAAIKQANEAVAAIVAVPDNQRTFQNTLGAIDDLAARFESSVSMLIFMSNVHPDASVRAASEAAEQQANDFLIDLGKREDLYRAVKAYAATNPKLEGEQKRFMEFTLRDYRRAGMDLSPEQRARLSEVQKEIGKLGIGFSKNIAEDESVVLLTPEELAGVPDEFVKSLPRSAGVCILDLSYPVYMQVMENCTNESSREKMWTTYKRRGGKKNVAVLEKAIKLRAEQARLLGYPNCAEYEIEVRMAKNYKAVQEFYEKLRPLVREKATLDLAEFNEAKRAQTGDPKAEFRPWDMAFIKNQLLKTKYAVDGEKVREYFPMQAAVDGLFNVTQSLYGLEYRDVTATKGGTKERPLWHPDVKLYEVYDKATNTLLGEFYLDMYPRENKYTHAAQWGLVQHKVSPDGTVTRPLAALVCNFSKPTADKPSLLQHEEVETFFHEFGHCLHTIVSTANMSRFAGTNVELDFVEAPSQMFENWVWDAEVLNTFARHYETGKPLPKDLLDGMLAAKTLGSGIETEGQFYYALTDLAYQTTSDGAVDTTRIATDLMPQLTLFGYRPENTYYQASFGHLMNYQAGYYSYMWSKVYASDMAKRFKELGMLSPEAGKAYRDKVIGRGGTRDAMDSVKDFLGREPQMDSFLDQLGLKKAN